METRSTHPSIKGLPTVALDEEIPALVLIDQTLLPQEVVLEKITDREEVWRAIARLEVRGAPAIGVAAALGYYLDAHHWLQAHPDATLEELAERLRETSAYLDSSRPTAVNLSWALARMDRVVGEAGNATPTELVGILRQEAVDILEEDARVCRAIGEHGVTLFQDGASLLTHCNAGRLATVAWGTATAPMYVAQERGWTIHAYCDETRPLLQGARLTALELDAQGIDVTLLCDGMSNELMATHPVDAVFVGCDRVAANGDVANKIGTSMAALAAAHHGVPFYVCAPTSTIDLACPDGASIPIEQRAPEEVTRLHYAAPMAPAGVHVYNPAFDVTEAALVTAIVTEQGIAYPPYDQTLPPLVAAAEKVRRG